MSKVQLAARAVVEVVPQVLLRLEWVPKVGVGEGRLRWAEGRVVW